MAKLFMNDVGSAQNIVLWPMSNNSVVVDMGIEHDKWHQSCPFGSAPCSGAKTFILSHFHSDHYNAFDYTCSGCTLQNLSFERVYYPKMPYIAGTNCVDPSLINLIKHCISLNLRLPLGRRNTHIFNFIQKLIQLSQNPSLKFIPVKKGDKIDSDIEILWPLDKVSKPSIKNISNYVTPFRELIETDRALSDIFKVVEKIAEKTNQLAETWHIESIGEELRTLIRIYERAASYPTVDLTQQFQLHAKIKDVLNSWSLAFQHVEDEILFLGDLNASQINYVCKDVSRIAKPRQYDILVAAHHGTHAGMWLKCIRANTTVASIGKSLMNTSAQQKAFLKYSNISQVFSYTQNNGVIII